MSTTIILHVLLTHAQRGLQYLVCVSVCLSVCLLPRFLPPRATMRPTRLPAASAGHEQSFKMAFSFKMLRSGVLAIFAYAAKSAIFFHL